MSGTRVPAFTDAGQPDGETITAGLLGGFSTDTGYDSKQRKNAFTALRNSATLASTGWTYDALETVAMGSDTGTYVYHLNSTLVNTLTMKHSSSTACDYAGRRIHKTLST